MRWNPLGSDRGRRWPSFFSRSQSHPPSPPLPTSWLAQEPLQVSSENPASLQVMPRWGLNSVSEKVRWWEASNLHSCCLVHRELQPGMEQHRVPSQLALLSPSVRREFNMSVHWEGREEPGWRGVRRLGRQVGREEFGHYVPRLESGLAEVSGNPAPCLQDLCRHLVTNPPAHLFTSVFLCACPACLCAGWSPFSR